ncbi:ferritin family protein [candidate division CSSED10-310 bacterium]|uniref:Ferritin family protein n=1 Tax=candidate division CSSED10-310 bacterium TaxID=2855610 RepID=A0ABV6YUU6_UNCC1
MMDIEEAIKMAIVYEMKVRDVYDDAARNATDQVGSRVFQLLAKEEQYHLYYLEDRLAEWQKQGKLSPEKLKTSIPSKKVILQEVDKLEKKMSGPDRGQELEMLRKALEVEKETSTFYRKMVDELTGQGKEMFARFVEIEDGHLAIVEAEIDAVSGSGFWFDMQEFSLERE